MATRIEANVSKPIALPAPAERKLSEPAPSALLDPMPFPVGAAPLNEDVIERIAVLLAKSAQEDKKTNQALRESAEAMREVAEKREVECMHEKANDIRMGGILEGGLTAGSGVLTGCLAAAGKTDEEKAAWRKRADGGSEILKGGAKVVGACYQAEETLDDEHATVAKHTGEHAASRVKDADDRIENARAVLKKVFAFYEQMKAAKEQAQSAAARRV